MPHDFLKENFFTTYFSQLMLQIMISRAIKTTDEGSGVASPFAYIIILDVFTVHTETLDAQVFATYTGLHRILFSFSSLYHSS